MRLIMMESDTVLVSVLTELCTWSWLWSVMTSVWLIPHTPSGAHRTRDYIMSLFLNLILCCFVPCPSRSKRLQYLFLKYSLCVCDRQYHVGMCKDILGCLYNREITWEPLSQNSSNYVTCDCTWVWDNTL